MLRHNCPTCKTAIIWSKQNPFRPFCSQRCQMIDFGEWANESYSIPAKPDAASFEQLDEEQLAEIVRRMSPEDDKV